MLGLRVYYMVRKIAGVSWSLSVVKMRVTLVSDQYTRDLTRQWRTSTFLTVQQDQHCFRGKIMQPLQHCGTWWSYLLFVLVARETGTTITGEHPLVLTHEVVYDSEVTWPSCDTSPQANPRSLLLTAGKTWRVIDNLTSGRVWNKYTLDRTRCEYVLFLSVLKSIQFLLM